MYVYKHPYSTGVNIQYAALYYYCGHRNHSTGGGGRPDAAGHVVGRIGTQHTKMRSGCVGGRFAENHPCVCVIQRYYY